MCRYLSLLVVLCLLCCLSDSAEKTRKIQPRIVGGRTTSVASRPYLVNLNYHKSFYCGGSLVSPRFVVTAGHCAYQKKRRDIVVVAGVSTLAQRGQRSGVKKIFLPSKFKFRTLNYDVAVFKLKRALEGNNISTIPLCSKKWKNRQKMYISGWGYTRASSRLPSYRMRTTNVPVISTKKCRKMYFGEARLTSTMFCAAKLGRRDACSGDSGGPAVYKGELCGIVSWGIGCASGKYPGVYTNVNKVKGFIKQAMKK